MKCTGRVVNCGLWLAGVTLSQPLERPMPPETELVLLSSENHFVFKLLPE